MEHTTTLVFGSPDWGHLHETGPGHPERPERLGAVYEGVQRAELSGEIRLCPGRAATVDELLPVHRLSYLNAVRDLVASGAHEMDPDTAISEGSWEAALLAAGSGLEAVNALQRGDGKAAFVAVRPPGHHASASMGMGFCLLNNVAIAAARLAAVGERVLILDWDVHHGNGTQEIFWDDPRVLYVSLHEWPAFPGTGRHYETGGPTATGLTVNIPLPPGATGDVALLAMDEIVAEAAEEFEPTWVLVSCGFDAHRNDPLAGLCWSAGDFAALTRSVLDLVSGPGHLTLFLEGGYDLHAVTSSTVAVLSTLTGETVETERPTSGGPGRDAVLGLRQWRQRRKVADRWS
jgi:acetoin utilization deacetylase AcuC-like enzyme